MRSILFLSLLVLTAGSSIAAEPVPHPFSVLDMLAMDRLGDPQVSPDGKWVAYQVSTPDLEKNKSMTDIWVTSVDGKTTRRLTTHPAADYNPRWCLNGTIYFLSTRGGSAQVWNIDPTGGEAVQTTDLKLGIGSMEIVPDLHSFLLTMQVYPGLGIQGTLDRDAEKKADPATGMVYDELMFRHWDTWEDGKRSHLFLLKGGSDEPVDLMPDLDADVPTFPWGGMEEVAVSPDGSEVVFTAKILPGSAPAWSTDYDLSAVKTDGSGERRGITEATEAWDTAPVFTTDGKTLCYLAMDRPGFEADRFHIELMDWATGESRRIDFEYDGLKLSPHGLKFSGNGRTIFATAGYLGQRSIFSIDVKSGQAKMVQKMGRNSSLNLLKGKLLFGHQSLKSPNELFTISTSGKGLTQITDFNGEKLAAALMGEPEQFTFEGWNDETVYALSLIHI